MHSTTNLTAKCTFDEGDWSNLLFLLRKTDEMGIKQGQPTVESIVKDHHRTTWSYGNHHGVFGANLSRAEVQDAVVARVVHEDWFVAYSSGLAIVTIEIKWEDVDPDALVEVFGELIGIDLPEWDMYKTKSLDAM